MNKEKSYAKYPHVVFRKMKNFATKDNQNGEQIPTDWILRVDSTHNQESAIANFLKDGNRIIGHNNLDPNKHRTLLAFIGGVTGSGLDSRLFDEKQPSPLEEKVKNERAKREA